MACTAVIELANIEGQAGHHFWNHDITVCPKSYVEQVAVGGIHNKQRVVHWMHWTSGAKTVCLPVNHLVIQARLHGVGCDVTCTPVAKGIVAEGRITIGWFGPVVQPHFLRQHFDPGVTVGGAMPANAITGEIYWLERWVRSLTGHGEMVAGIHEAGTEDKDA